MAEPDIEAARYKKVAIVEDFFDIIYNVHVEMDGRGGKHAGQKRTYRAVSPTAGVSVDKENWNEK